MLNDKKEQNREKATKNNRSEKNMNHFPEESISQSRKLPDNGDDFREPFEEGAGNGIGDTKPR